MNMNSPSCTISVKNKNLPNLKFSNIKNSYLKENLCNYEEVYQENLVKNERETINESLFSHLPEVALARSLLESSERLYNLQPTLSHLFFGCSQATSRLAHLRAVWSGEVAGFVLPALRRVSMAVSEEGQFVRSRRQAWKAGADLRSVSARAEKATLAALSSTQTVNSIQKQDTHDGDRSLLGTKETQAVNGSESSGPSTANHARQKSIQSELSAQGCRLSKPTRPASMARALFANTANGHTNAIDTQASQQLLRTAKAAQLNAIKEDLEMEVQTLKEHALHQLYSFESTSTLECAKALLDFVEVSARYHRQCAAILEELGPKMQEELYNQCPLPVFGRDLHAHLRSTGRTIAYPIALCVKALDSPEFLVEEGLFRMSGSKRKVDALTSALNTLRAESVIDQYDPHVVADSLKQYLRSLPDPLLTAQLSDDWISTHDSPSLSGQVGALKEVVARMPTAERTNAACLFWYLHRFVGHSSSNRMTAANLAIIFEPTLLAPVGGTDVEHDGLRRIDEASESINPFGLMMEAKSERRHRILASFGARKHVIELLITHANKIFESSAATEECFTPKGQRPSTFQTSSCLRSGVKCEEEVPPDERPSVSETAEKMPAREILSPSRLFWNLPQRLCSKPWSPPINWSSLFQRAHLPGSTRSRTSTKKAGVGLSASHLQLCTRSPVLEPRPRVEVSPTRNHVSLRQDYQQWRQAMLECSDKLETLSTRSPHADLYDTLFTLKALNSADGAEHFLSRVRSCNKSKSTHIKTLKDVDLEYTVSESFAPYARGSSSMFRRHSEFDIQLCAEYTPSWKDSLTRKLQAHLKKAMTSPSDMVKASRNSNCLISHQHNEGTLLPPSTAHHPHPPMGNKISACLCSSADSTESLQVGSECSLTSGDTANWWGDTISRIDNDSSSLPLKSASSLSAAERVAFLDGAEIDGTLSDASKSLDALKSSNLQLTPPSLKFSTKSILKSK